MTDVARRLVITEGTSVLVTGGAGFIGSHLVERLVSRGCSVTVIDSELTGDHSNLRAVIDQVDLVRTDVSSAITNGKVSVEAFDLVVHLAANPYVPWSVKNPGHDFRLNAQASFDVLEAIRTSSRRPRLINISSAAVYGDPERQPIDESTPLCPISPYGVSKLAAERYVDVYHRCYGVAGASLRLFSVYGPRQRKQVVFDLLRKCREGGGEMEVLGDGSQERDFVFVSDVVDAILLAAERAPAKGEAYNIASGRTVSIRTLAAAVCAAWGYVPHVRFTGQVRPGDAEKWTPSISRIMELGYQPSVKLDAGLAAIRDWLLVSSATPVGDPTAPLS